MSLRVKIILICLITVASLLVLLSIGAVVRYFWKSNPAPSPEQQEQTVSGTQLGTSPTTPSTSQEIPQQEVPAPSPAKPGDEIISLVLPFVERFGSYSNQGNFENLSDLLPFMSDAMRAWANKEIEKQSSKPFQELYRGVTTKALSYTVVDYKPEQNRAEMKVATQRKELIGSTTNARMYNQDVVVKLIKADGVWLVESAFWK